MGTLALFFLLLLVCASRVLVGVEPLPFPVRAPRGRGGSGPASTVKRGETTACTHARMRSTHGHSTPRERVGARVRTTRHVTKGWVVVADALPLPPTRPLHTLIPARGLPHTRPRTRKRAHATSHARPRTRKLARATPDALAPCPSCPRELPHAGAFAHVRTCAREPTHANLLSPTRVRLPCLRARANVLARAQNRLMNQPAGASERLYSGMLDCLVKTVKREGPLSLYNGFLPNFLRIGPWCAIMFTTYVGVTKRGVCVGWVTGV